MLVMERPNTNSCSVNEWRQWCHEILFNILLSVFYSEWLHAWGITCLSLFSLSSQSLWGAGKWEFPTSIPCTWLLPVAVDDNRSSKCKVSQLSTSCRLPKPGATAEWHRELKRATHLKVHVRSLSHYSYLSVMNKYIP